MIKVKFAYHSETDKNTFRIRQLRDTLKDKVEASMNLDATVNWKSASENENAEKFAKEIEKTNEVIAVMQNV